jgi:hypothetical protein
MKEQKIKLLLTYVKKKIKDEGIINQRRKVELLKRIIINLLKTKMNNLLLAFKVWNKITKLLKDEDKRLIRETENGFITNINGKEKIIDQNDFKEGGGVNIKLVKNKDGVFTIEDIANTTLTENERKEVLNKKLPATINLIDDKKRRLLQIKLYQWKNNARKISCIKNATIIQRFIRQKLGKYFLKKRTGFFTYLAKNYFKRIILNAAKINVLQKNIKKIMFGRLFDKLKKNRDNNISINNLNDTLLKVSDNLKNQNKKFALEKLLKLYTYIILQKLFDHIYKSYKSKTKGELIIFWNALKMNLLKKQNIHMEINYQMKRNQFPKN